MKAESLSKPGRANDTVWYHLQVTNLLSEAAYFHLGVASDGEMAFKLALAYKLTGERKCYDKLIDFIQN